MVLHAITKKCLIKLIYIFLNIILLHLKIIQIVLYTRANVVKQYSYRQNW